VRDEWYLRLRQTAMKLANTHSKQPEDYVHPMSFLLRLNEHDRLLTKCPLYQR